MKVLHRKAPDFAKPDVTEENNERRSTEAGMRDRWDAVRHGPVGRILGYCAAFTVFFLLITLLLWSLESYRF